jgi:hypothetical protein
MSRALRRAVPLLTLLAALLWAGPAIATVVVPLPDDELAAQADAIVLGRVTRITSHWDPHQARIFTTIDIAVEEVLKGEVAEDAVTLTQQGGTVGGVDAWLHGNPEFHRGEKVVVFITEAADGTLRVTHLYQGKFSVSVDPYLFEELAQRDPNPGGVHALPVPGGTRPMDSWKLRDLKDSIRAWGAMRTSRHTRLRRSVPVSASAVSTTADTFTFLTFPSRWFEPDEGRAVTVVTDQRGEPRTPGGAFEEVRAALNVWSSAAGSSLELRDGGLGYAPGLMYDGVNTVSFRDPASQIDPPSGCRGTLAIGGFYRTLQQKVINGKTFSQIVDADLTTADGWQGCGFYESRSNMAEVLTHELGHMLGFGHNMNQAATMAPVAHFDGRGAWLHPDDIAGLVFAYPGSGPGTGGTSPVQFSLWVYREGTGNGTVVSAPSGVNCGTTCAQSFDTGTTVTLTATPSSSAAFTGWSGACTGLGQCTVAMTANTAVTATFVAVRPDLQLTAVSAPPASAVRGGRFTVTDTVTNAGAAGANSSRTRYYLSLTGTRTSSDVLLAGSRLVYALAAGGNSAGSVTLTVPTAAPMGTYRVLACADDTLVVVESIETNNCRASATAIVIGMPDLVTAAVSNPPASTRRGTAFDVTDTVRNQGDAAAGTSTTRYFLSLDGARDTADRMMMGNRPVGTLSPGDVSSGTARVVIPSSLTPGSYFVVACADDAQRVVEGGGANNCRASATKVSVTP